MWEEESGLGLKPCNVLSYKSALAVALLLHAPFVSCKAICAFVPVFFVLRGLAAPHTASFYSLFFAAYILSF